MRSQAQLAAACTRTYTSQRGRLGEEGRRSTRGARGASRCCCCCLTLGHLLAAASLAGLCQGSACWRRVGLLACRRITQIPDCALLAINSAGKACMQLMHHIPRGQGSADEASVMPGCSVTHRAGSVPAAGCREAAAAACCSVGRAGLLSG